MSGGTRRPSAPDASFADRAFRVTAEAYAETAAEWERAVHRALGELLAFLAEHPEQVDSCPALSPAGSADLVQRDQVVARFATLLRDGFRARREGPPEVVSEAIGGGILELIRAHVRERRVRELEGALPTATIIALTPFVGPEQAAEVASDPRNVHADR